MKEKIIVCPRCKSKEIVKYGKRKIKVQEIQIYKCKQCENFFSDREMKYKSYQENIILNAISIYNLGYSLEETKNQVAKRFRTRIPLSTIHSWIEKYKNICGYSKLREEGRKSYAPENIIFSKEFDHKQTYKFQYHKAKLDMKFQYGNQRKLQLFKEYLEWIAKKRESCSGTKSKRPFPHHIFTQKSEESKQRASQIKMERFTPVEVTKNNLANSLAEYGLKLAKTNYARHEKVQDFMLINDSVTVAAEVPVYLTNDDIKYFKEKGFQFNFSGCSTPITGHIDLLQIRNGLIYILDYKPDARKEKPFEQLMVYALALGSRTKLAIKDFKCAWFDDKNYYEFFPLHMVYKSRKR
ncbi:MAG: PD-(D/E)XK nuclease family protein [Candidatus Zapsychrus exili]|nr:PD-(D/E)XK nuclease family protein [Candidatus Zapsychrus exili]